MARINARLDDAVARKLEDIRRHTGQTTTGVVLTAIEQYHERIEASAGARALQIFEEAGFVGCAEGPRDLAERAKEYLDFARYVREDAATYGAPRVPEPEAGLERTTPSTARAAKTKKRAMRRARR